MAFSSGCQTLRFPEHIFIVQDPPPSVLAEIRVVLGDKAAQVYPRKRSTFWFEHANRHLLHSDTSYHLIIPYQLPPNARTDKIPDALARIGSKFRIKWVAVPFQVLEGHVRTDNDIWKAGFHGLHYPHQNMNTENFCPSSSLEYTRLLAEKTSDVIQEIFLRTNRVVGVSVQNRYMCLVPQNLRNIPSIQSKFVMTYFHHIDQTDRIPLFCSMPYVKEIVYSLCQANAVNFHTNRHARNFLGAVEYLFGSDCQIDHQNLTIRFREHTTRVGSHFLGVDVDRWKHLSRNETAWKFARKIFEMSRGRKILLGFDRCDPIKSIDKRVQIFTRFLETNPSHANEFVLIHAYYLANDTKREYKDVYRSLLERVDELTKEVNTQYSHVKPIIALPKLSAEEVAGLVIAGCLSGGTHVCTSQAEGLHMGVLESVVVSAQLSLEMGDALDSLLEESGIDVSEVRKEEVGLSFWTSNVAGVYDRLKPMCVGMHPLQVEESVLSLEEAVSMSRDEKISRLEKGYYGVVEEHTCAEWVDDIRMELRELANMESCGEL